MATKRPDGRVEPGQRISSAFSARAWNRAQDAADVVLGARTGAEAGASAGVERASNIVLVQNNSGQDVPWLGVLGISGVAIDIDGGTLDGTNAQSARLREAVARPVLSGVAPLSGTHDDAFVVAIEPIEYGKIGRCASGGTLIVCVNVLNYSHKYATVKNNDVTQLQSAGCGSVQLLTKPNLPPGSGRFCVGSM
jgi:hypothetical protein